MNRLKAIRIVLLILLIVGILFWLAGHVLRSTQLPNRTDFSSLAKLTPEEVARFSDALIEFRETQRYNQDTYSLWPDIRGSRESITGHESTVFLEGNLPDSGRYVWILIDFFETHTRAEEWMMYETSFGSRWASSSQDRVQEIIENDNDTSILVFRVRHDIMRYYYRNFYQVQSVIRIGNGVFRLRSTNNGTVWNFGSVFEMEALHSEIIEVISDIITRQL